MTNSKLEALEAARDHELLELEGTPQDIVDFRRKHVPALIFHACPECGEMDPRQSRDMDQSEDYALICWECETSFTPSLSDMVNTRLENGSRIVIDIDKPPRNPVPPKPANLGYADVSEQLRKDLEGLLEQLPHLISAEIESTGLTGGSMDINDWIDQTLAVKGYIQAQEDREDFYPPHWCWCNQVQQVDEESRLVLQQANGSMDSKQTRLLR